MRLKQRSHLLNNYFLKRITPHLRDEIFLVAMNQRTTLRRNEDRFFVCYLDLDPAVRATLPGELDSNNEGLLPARMWVALFIAFHLYRERAVLIQQTACLIHRAAKSRFEVL